MPNLLSVPYRDRQFLTVVGPEKPARPPAEIRLSDYIGLKAQRENTAKFLRNPGIILSKSHWADTKNLGLFGYLKDKFEQANPQTDNGAVRNVQRIDAREAEQILNFQPGHPLYDTVYAGHPLLPPIYVPVASFHPFLFQEKLNELMKLLASLGAVEVNIHYIRGYSQMFAIGAGAGVDLPMQLSADAGGSFQRYVSDHSKTTLHARFSPHAQARLPVTKTWYEHEPTWVHMAEARLGSGLKEIDVQLRYDDDFGVSAKLAFDLSGCGLSLGGAFQKHEQTAWGFHASFG